MRARHGERAWLGSPWGGGNPCRSAAGQSRGALEESRSRYLDNKVGGSGLGTAQTPLARALLCGKPRGLERQRSSMFLGTCGVPSAFGVTGRWGKGGLSWSSGQGDGGTNAPVLGRDGSRRTASAASSGPRGLQEPLIPAPHQAEGARQPGGWCWERPTRGLLLPSLPGFLGAVGTCLWELACGKLAGTARGEQGRFSMRGQKEAPVVGATRGFRLNSLGHLPPPPAILDPASWGDGNRSGIQGPRIQNRSSLLPPHTQF